MSTYFGLLYDHIYRAVRALWLDIRREDRYNIYPTSILHCLARQIGPGQVNIPGHINRFSVNFLVFQTKTDFSVPNILSVEAKLNPIRAREMRVADDTCLVRKWSVHFCIRQLVDGFRLSVSWYTYTNHFPCMNIAGPLPKFSMYQAETPSW